MKQSPVLYNINTFDAKGHVLSSCRSVYKLTPLAVSL